MSLMKSDRTKAPKSDRIAGYAITLAHLSFCLFVLPALCAIQECTSCNEAGKARVIMSPWSSLVHLLRVWLWVLCTSPLARVWSSFLDTEQ